MADRQHNGQKKRTNNEVRNTTQIDRHELQYNPGLNSSDVEV